MNCFVLQTNLLRQPTINWLGEHLTRHLSEGNLEGVSFLSICLFSGRYCRGMSLGAFYLIETDEIRFLFMVFSAQYGLGISSVYYRNK